MAFLNLSASVFALYERKNRNAKEGKVPILPQAGLPAA